MTSRPITSSIVNYFTGKEVLITGAGGTVGKEVVRQLSNVGISKLVLLERSENALYTLINNLPTNVNFVPVLCDVLDEQAVNRVFSSHKINIVIHAAAYKHIHIVEANPEEAWRNNFEAVKVLAKIAEKFEVERFALVSTDKAVSPKSILGITKLEAEKFLMQYNKSSKTSFCAIRFGNLFAAPGSVVQIFKEKVANKEPLAVTHRDMERYFITANEAVELFLQAVTRDERVVYSLDMGKSQKILNIAEDIIRQAGFRPYIDIPIEFVGIRPGEKIREQHDLSEKSAEKTDMPKIYITKLLLATVAMAAMCVFADNSSSIDEVATLSENDSKASTDNEEGASKPGFERYEPILKRQMFGTPPPGFDPQLSPSNVKASRREGEKEELTPDQQKLQKAVRFTVLNLDSSGNVMVGFSDHTDGKLPKHFYMKVGETFRGWKVLEADVLAGTAALEKDGIRLDMTLGEQAKAAQPNPNAGGNGGRSMSERRLMRQRAREADERARVEKEKRDAQAAQVAQEQREQEAVERAENNMIILELSDELKKNRAEREATAAAGNKEQKESSNVEN